MKPNRRGFLGGVIGAVAAGPAAARTAAASLLGPALSTTGVLGGYYDNVAASGQIAGGTKDYRSRVVDRIAELRGLSRADRRARYGSFRDEADRVAVLSLRSVADCQKARMIYERGIERAVERDLRNALMELAGIDG